ncbi:MAG: hypothetical protein K0R09_942 [Clostridiales bacterium]|jgi:putative radical SAM enzyme (TIGR03279 family)|nr:hypothetical protein [Clostridiales bacterium]
MKSMDIVITHVERKSIAEEAGIEAGDVLLSINGNAVHDIIEYRFLMNDEKLNVIIKKSNGEEWDIEIEKDFYDDLGLEFEDPSMDNPKRCHNKCIFCFIDQLPEGMRESLYFKDDDSRLSFLHGNFITLTNMKDDDINRIIQYRISPINVSVHTTNPELRVKMLNHKNAGKIMGIIKRLVDGGIQINSQIVLCPGINDGYELERTINDLYRFYPNIENVAIVPVGISKYREKLFELEGYTRETSNNVIQLVHKMQKKFVDETGEPFVRLGDEFYINADFEMPSFEHYGDFEQLEDGIGMIRYFENCIKEDLSDKDLDGKGKSFALITGTSSTDFMKRISNVIERSLNIKISVYTIKNNFFGERITVTGLITGKDIIEQVKGRIKEEVLFMPSNMLKADKDIFLDDLTLEELGAELGVKIIKCKYSGDDFIDKIMNEVL